MKDLWRLWKECALKGRAGLSWLQDLEENVDKRYELARLKTVESFI